MLKLKVLYSACKYVVSFRKVLFIFILFTASIAASFYLGVRSERERQHLYRGGSSKLFEVTEKCKKTLGDSTAYTARLTKTLNSCSNNLKKNTAALVDATESLNVCISKMKSLRQ